MHIINMAARTNPMCREGGVILRGKWPCSRQSLQKISAPQVNFMCCIISLINFQIHSSLQKRLKILIYAKNRDYTFPDSREITQWDVIKTQE